MLIIAIIFIALSLLIKYQLGERSFNRRNAFGLQQFKSYRDSLTTRFRENLLRFLMNVLAILGGTYARGTFFCLENHAQHFT